MLHVYTCISKAFKQLIQRYSKSYNTNHGVNTMLSLRDRAAIVVSKPFDLLGVIGWFSIFSSIGMLIGYISTVFYYSITYSVRFIDVAQQLSSTLNIGLLQDICGISVVFGLIYSLLYADED